MAGKYFSGSGSPYPQNKQYKTSGKSENCVGTRKVFVSDLAPVEAVKFRALLVNYFPWLGTEEDVCGSEVIDELNTLFESLPKTRAGYRFGLKPSSKSRKTRPSWGMFHMAESGSYHVRSALQTFVHRAAAIHRAEFLMRNRDGLNLIVRELKDCHGYELETL